MLKETTESASGAKPIIPDVSPENGAVSPILHASAPTRFNKFRGFCTLLMKSAISVIRELCSKKVANDNSSEGDLTAPTRPEKTNPNDEEKRDNRERSVTTSDAFEPSHLTLAVDLSPYGPLKTQPETDAAPTEETEAASESTVADPESSQFIRVAEELTFEANKQTISGDNEDSTPATLSMSSEAPAVVASDHSIIIEAESATSTTAIPPPAPLKQAPALNKQELERIRFILNAFNEQKNVNALVENSTEKAKLALKKVQDELQVAYETLITDLEKRASTASRDLTPAEIATAKSAFKEECEFHVKDALACGLADDLSWVAYLLNMLRELCNAVISKVSGNSNQFFALAKSPLEQSVDVHVSRLVENHDAAGMQP